MSKQTEFQIVATNYMLRYFKSISIFKLELGSALKHLNNKPGQAPKVKIKDLFVKKYEGINPGKIIHKYGSIGVMHFYEDTTLPRYEFHVYKNDQVFEIVAYDEDLKKTPQEYLTEILKMIDGDTGKDPEKTEDGTFKNIAYTTVPDELSNYPDMNLPKDQYVEALVKRRKLQEKIKNQNHGIR